MSKFVPLLILSLFHSETLIYLDSQVILLYFTLNKSCFSVNNEEKTGIHFVSSASLHPY